MLDAFKNIAGGKGKLVQKQSDELELLIATAREERSAISTMLTALTTRGAKLTPLSKTLEQVADSATSVGERLDDITRRLATLDDRATVLENGRDVLEGPASELRRRDDVKAFYLGLATPHRARAA